MEKIIITDKGWLGQISMCSNAQCSYSPDSCETPHVVTPLVQFLKLALIEKLSEFQQL